MTVTIFGRFRSARIGRAAELGLVLQREHPRQNCQSVAWRSLPSSATVYPHPGPGCDDEVCASTTGICHLNGVVSVLGGMLGTGLLDLPQRDRTGPGSNEPERLAIGSDIPIARSIWSG